jgi:hypothetical protein
MRIRSGYEITYECPQPTPMLLLLNVHSSRYQDLETPDFIRTDPHIPITQYHDTYGNLCSRLVLPAGRTVLSADFVVRDTGQPDQIAPNAIQHPVEDLPNEVIVFLLASRYCETEHLVAVRRHSARLGAAAGDPRLRAQPDHLRLPACAADQDGLGGA